jgi:hypothetical protein
MSNAVPIANADDVRACLAGNIIPKGYIYTVVNISLSKRLLACDIPTRERLELLESLEVDDERWLTPEMVAAIEPMDDRGYQIVSEARRLDAGKILDVFAEHFSTFAVLNPSLIAALRMQPGFRAPEICQ